MAALRQADRQPTAQRASPSLQAGDNGGSVLIAKEKDRDKKKKKKRDKKSEKKQNNRKARDRNQRNKRNRNTNKKKANRNQRNNRNQKHDRIHKNRNAKSSNNNKRDRTSRPNRTITRTQRDRIYRQGLRDGKDRGYNKGVRTGYREGVDKGRKRGYGRGYDRGYHKAKNRYRGWDSNRWRTYNRTKRNQWRRPVVVNNYYGRGGWARQRGWYNSRPWGGGWYGGWSSSPPWGWWLGQSVVWGVTALTTAAIINDSIDRSIERRQPTVLVPDTNWQLYYGSVEPVENTGVTFAVSNGSGTYAMEADCEEGLLNGAVPTTPAEAQLINAACQVTFGTQA
ncbi:hypothetical protein [Cyanobium sp. LEGE 06143]|uniref:hypothetical protein n=1 Tax=Cyanobium sp. LEGE 06143 TaxID=945727 RepID=UPI001D13B5A4|nr:hypothetical protein [Cyanobium sp. LEGE 06143]